MTDDEIRAVFEELRRLGVDFAQPPGLALGTGFSEGELISWLRALPDDLGHDGFVMALDQHVSAAEPNAGSSLPNSPGGRPHRSWPTVEQLRAAIEVLVREWDPLGARLGALASDDVTHHAVNALGLVLHGGDPERIEHQISARLASVEQEVFGVRPSPLEQRRYLARRLIRIVVDNPGPAHEEDAWEELRRASAASMELARAEGRLKESRTRTGSGVTVCFGPRGEEVAPLDLAASCTSCGTIGTVAVVGREVEPLVWRYCPTCWPRFRERYFGVFGRRRPRPEEETTPEGIIAAFDETRDEMLFTARARARYAASALWDDRLPFVEAALTPDERVSPADRERQLQQLADDLVAQAPRMYGPMPPAIETFVRRYARPDPPPASPHDQH